MFHKPENFFFNPRQNYYKNDEFHDELNDLFNKKFQFRFNSDWELPELDSWFSAPPWKVKELESLKYRLNFHKSQLNDFNIEEWSSHTRRRNPAGDVGWKLRSLVNPEFLTQAWTKFYECASTYNIIPREAVMENQMVSLHLCEAPGAFITSLNHYLQQNYPRINWKWVANTLNPYYEGNSPSNMISDDRFMFHTLPSWHFGVDNTGNLMHWGNSQDIVATTQAKGKVLLVTADGSIDCLQRPEAQEEMTSPLHYCEIVTALQALSPGGTLIFKLFTTFEHCTVSLLYLINHLFQEVNIYKPVTSRQGNSEVYAVCLKYKGIAEKYLPVLKTAYGTELYGNMALFPVEKIPEDFLKQVQECAFYFCSIQCQVIDNNLQAYLMQNNVNLHRDMKRIRAMVAAEFLWLYDLKPLEYEREILKGILHEENKINMNPRYHRGSYTERQLYTKMSLREKLNNLNAMLQAEAVSNPFILIQEKVRWFEFFDGTVDLNLTFTHGLPLQKINSSKFIFVPIFKLYQQILAEPEFREIMLNESTTEQTENEQTTQYEVEITKSLVLPDFNYTESYSSYEKKCFKALLRMLTHLKLGQSAVVRNFHALTHFNASILYVLARKCFEKVGFTTEYSLILNSLKDLDGFKLLDVIERECERLKADNERDVLNTLTVKTTNCGEFYDNVILFNNTFYRNKCVEYLSLIGKFV